MFQIQILGTSSAIPTHLRKLSAQVVTINDRHHLVDCGEGTQMQLLRYKIKLARLDAIFISHMHGDHVLGLPGLLNSLTMYERNFPLKLFGPASLERMLNEIFSCTFSHLGYELDFVPLEEFQPGDVVFEKSSYEVRLLPLDHRIFCRGFLFRETQKRPKFDFYKAKSLDIPNAYFNLLKQGNIIELDDGRTFHPEDVLLPPDPPYSYAYCSDTCYHEALIDHIQEVQFLYHEATFMEKLSARAKSTHHSTAKEAATIAQRSSVRHLLLGHFSARYKTLQPLLEEAREIFPQTYLAREGDIYKLKEYV